ncbi:MULTISPECIES: hypothetical protein [Bacillus cereus group]|uniref:hypothetical protein n=1 Tax=Bacillus cereus group TaxID=86661 RepID=UPI00187A9776|nr:MULTISPECIES: hypothetical protein [Bacillus cereus group]MBE7145035.1 hypothetical protein [Bacillus paranthracis]MCU5212888.1 hypothetical protein [Bacillus paranthracis]MDA2593623.1 hypothetical protein [Bacillus cereus group sp. Bc065]HDR7527016.1 hypothetical protein [Bacillus paranthracis]
MDSQTKKSTRSINGLIKSISIIILVVGFIVYLGLCINDYLDKTNKIIAIKTEQSQENIKIAEKMVEKELNISSKYFKMIGIQPFLLGEVEVELNANTEASWIEKDLTCKVQVNGENYSVIFETQKVDSENEELEMYEPVKINKIIKEQK